MESKFRHYRVVSRNKNASAQSILPTRQQNIMLFALSALLIWIFGIMIGCLLSHNK